MFGFIADILTSVTSILFPIFASYKALRSSDPAVLTPWLMYWTTLSLFLLVESQLYFILYWVPFYPWFRLIVHLYLVAPGKQGSVFIYREYIHPFLEEHERQIDQMITNGHAKAKAAGLDAVQRAIEYIRVQFLGGQPKQPTPPASRSVSYSTYLFDRFAMPSARQGLAGSGAADLLGMLSRTVQGQADTTTSRGMTESGTLIPPDLTGQARNDFVHTQRERLQALMSMFDAEASGAAPLPNPSHPISRKPVSEAANLSKSRSESEFEDLAYEQMPDPDHYRPARKQGGGWNNWLWGSYGEKDSAAETRKDM